MPGCNGGPRLRLGGRVYRAENIQQAHVAAVATRPSERASGPNRRLRIESVSGINLRTSTGVSRYGTVICVFAAAPLPQGLVATTAIEYVPGPAVPDKLKPGVENVPVNAPLTITR